MHGLHHDLLHRCGIRREVVDSDRSADRGQGGVPARCEIAAGAFRDTGELYVTGVGLAHGYLAHGYLARAAETAERFVPNPFGPPGARMYRTGDIARYTREGLLEFMGRADAQIKVRGFRVDQHEIEAALVRLPSVARAAVILREDHPGEKRLIGYVVPEAGMQPDLKELRRSLPGYLLPAALVPVETLPLTANGKLDRRALPPPPAAATKAAPRARKPKSPCATSSRKYLAWTQIRSVPMMTSSTSAWIRLSQ
jgi:acyl-coenzyme A synthetase/AMP-(fatty) acid ligase